MSRKTNKDELALREFYSIALAKNLSFVEQVNCLLEQGCEYLQLKCAIISYVENDRYTILHVFTNSEQYKILTGDVFELGATYCQFTLEQGKAVGFNHAGKTDIAKHPSYSELKLEAYLGAPTFLNDKVFGTVNFTSIEARENEFSESEKYYVQLIAEWLSSQLEKHYEKRTSLDLHHDIASQLQNKPHTFIDLTEKYEVITWSKNAETILGWEYDQVINKRPDQWFGIDEQLKIELIKALDQLGENPESTRSFSLKYVKNNGELVFTEWFIARFDDHNSSQKMIRCHVLDTTERQTVEEELLRQNARYLDLYENAPDMYLSLNQVGSIISANKLTHQLLGYKSSELLGKPYWNLILKSDIRRIRRLIEVAFLGDVNELEMEASLVTRSGHILRTHQRIRIIQIKKGMPRELRVIARDVTERKRGQASQLHHMQQQRDEISHEVQHRIKNSLQAVIGLLTMNIDAHPELKPALTTSIAQVNTISVVNGLILDDKEDIEIMKLFDGLAKASSQLFNYTADIEVNRSTQSKIMLVQEEVIPVSLIYSELLINAFKYHHKSLSGDNFIRLQLDLSDEHVNVEISNTYLSKNDDNNQSTHLGKTMINSLLPPVGAKIQYEVTENTYITSLTLLDPVIVHEVV